MRPTPPLSTLAALVLLTLATAPALVRAQEPPPPPGPAETLGDPQTFEESVSVSWVLVPVVVRDRQGHVEGLDRDDFRLFVDDRRVPVRELDLGSEVPLSVVYLQDLSGSMANGGKLESSRRALGTLIDATREGDQVALSTFAGGRLIIDVPFTDDTGALRESMDTWEGYGTTALHDAVSLLPDISEGGRSGRRVAVLVTDGLDNASALDPEAALRVVRGARLPVYVIGLTAGAPADRGRSGRRGGEEDEVLYSDLLSNLAERTGGRYFEVADEAAAGEAVADLVEDLRSRYVLGFNVAGGGARTYHPIRVEVALPYRHTLTYRRGYTGTTPD